MENPLKALLKKPKIEVLVCLPSKGGQENKRLKGYSLEGCFENFLETTDLSKVNVTLFLDAKAPDFLYRQNHFPIIENHPEMEANSFLAILDYVINQKLSKETILYFLDLSTLHKKGWVDVLIESFTLKEADYVTLCDSRDRYQGSEASARLFTTSRSHWGTIPATEGLFATKMKTFSKHLDIHREFSFQREETDHAGKFDKLARVGSHFIGSIPGWASSTEAVLASPCHPWEECFNKIHI
ncbi:MAG: hypothetical protein KR126chlam1_00545 [Chlamydiae bacterium]|nr:hypothetical protein [Chlamydiota bacterium]